MDERVGGLPSLPAKLVLWSMLAHDYEPGKPLSRTLLVVCSTLGAAAVVLPPLACRLVWGALFDVASGLLACSCVLCMAYSNGVTLMSNLGFLYAAAVDARRREHGLRRLMVRDSRMHSVLCCGSRVARAARGCERGKEWEVCGHTRTPQTLFDPYSEVGLRMPVDDGASSVEGSSVEARADGEGETGDPIEIIQLPQTERPPMLSDACA